MTIKEFFKSIPTRLNWQLNIFGWCIVVYIAALYPMIMYANPELFKENCWVETLQLIVLAAALVITVKAKYDRKFYIFVTMIVILMLMRETNMGRAYFCEKYLSPDEMCRWSKMKYGFIMEQARAVYGLFIVYYAIRHKLWNSVQSYLEKAPVYVWDVLFAVLGVIMGLIAETSLIDNEVMEECGEMLFYLAFTNLLWHYSRKDIAAA